ncbi:uncharacterized protein ARMOST_10347 [Armillaria ostoyae]|uniref:Uncharacterized protein n=1 Tax=Armillaria ostoyae TaxID=47428 RepID=A0A284RE57_ARMOS|nr:uncharacterized protein ARMOST_10347 [Armillaria ostoyae]
MTPQFSQSECRLSDGDTSTTLAPENQPNALTQSEIEESQKVLAVKLGWNIQASGPGEFPFTYRPAVDEACARLLDEGSRMMVDCLSPHLLGAQTLEPYAFVVGLSAALRYTIITDSEPVVVILVNSLQPLLHGGPPPLPQDIDHHVHVVQVATSHDLVGATSAYTSADDTHSCMPWIFEEVAPGRPIINLPFSQTATANDTDSRRSSVGLVLSIPSFKTPNHPPYVGPSRTDARPYVLTCAHYVLPKRAAPSYPIPTERRSQYLHHQYRTFTYREKVRSCLEERVANIESHTKKRLRAAGDKEAMCQAIRAKEAEQKNHYIDPWRTALANHDRTLSNPRADTEYCIGDATVAQNTVVSKSQVISRSLPSSSAPHGLGLPGDAVIMDWMLIEVADDISVTNKVGHKRNQCVQPTFACIPRANETVFVYRNNIDRSEGQYVGTTAYELENRRRIQYQHIVESWQQLSSFALRGDSGNIVVNKDFEPIGIVIRALVLPTDEKLTFLCDIKEVFNHIEEVLQLPQGAVKIFMPPSRV